MQKYFVLYLIIQTVTSFSQTTQSLRLTNGKMNLPTTDERFQYINPYDARNITLEGERYFYDSLYRAGELKTTTSLYTTELSYRFDQIERTVQVKMENGKQMFLSENYIEYFKLFVDDKPIIFVPAHVPNGKKLTMVQVIYKSPTLQLYRDVRKYIFRVKNDYYDGYSSNNVYDEIRKDYRYFIRKGDKGVFKEIKIDAKSFVAAFPEKRNQILQLFRAGQSKGGLSVSKLAQIMVELDKSEVKNDEIN